MFRKLAVGLILIAIVAGGLSTVTPRAAAQDDEFIFGVVLVGPRYDHGWSEAHYKPPVVQATCPARG